MMDPVSPRFVRTMRLVCFGLAVLSGHLVATAQLPQTRLQGIFPPGGQVGREFEVRVVSGSDLEDLTAMIFSHPGIQARPQLDEESGQPFAKSNTFVVQIDPATPPGYYECRVRGVFGESNPRRFLVTADTVIVETEPNNTPEDATPIELNAVIQGTLARSADLDWFQFTGRSGQTVVVRSDARNVDSKVLVTIELQTAAGQRLGYARSRYGDDPALFAELPKDGTYFIKFHDFTYQGSPDATYQLMVTDRPHIHSVVPPVVVAGQRQTVLLRGFQLPGGQPVSEGSVHSKLQQVAVEVEAPSRNDGGSGDLVIAPMQAGTDGFRFQWNAANGPSNAVFLPFADDVAVLESEPNDTSSQASQITVPAEIVGAFDRRGDVDYFQFEATKGSVLIVDVRADRIGSRADPYLIVEQVQKSKSGDESSTKRLVAADDLTTNLGGNDFNTLSVDSEYRLTVPEDGLYRLSIRDRYFEAQGGPELYYHLSVREETPRFRVVAFVSQSGSAANQPSQLGSLVVRRGGTVDVRIMAFRKDGFEGAIRVGVQNSVKGVTAQEVVLGAKQSAASLILHVGEDADVGEFELQLSATADIEDPRLVRQLDVAKTALDPMRKSVTAAEQSLAKIIEDLGPADEKLQKAKSALDKSPEDANLQKAVSQAQSAHDSLQKKIDEATSRRDMVQAELQAAEQEVAMAEKRRREARRTETVKVRPATLVWPGSNTAPSTARLCHALRLSIVDELAPFTVAANEASLEFTLFQGGQVLLPVEVIKRHGFDNNVSLTWNDVDRNSRIRTENKTISKGKTDETLRVTIDKATPAGEYTLFLRSQGQVSYSRNPARVERAKKSLDAVKNVYERVSAELAEATQQRDAAKKQQTEVGRKSSDLSNSVKQHQTTLAQASQRLATARKAADADRANLAKIKRQLETLKKEYDQVAMALKDAPEDEQRKQQLASLEPKLKEQQQQADATQQKLAKTEMLVGQAEKAVQAAKQTVAATSQELEAIKKQESEIVKKLATRETRLKDATSKEKTIKDRRTAAEQELKTAENAAKPKNINYFPAAFAVIVHVHETPLTVTASVPGGGNLKKGQSLEIKVTAKRNAGFDGPVDLSLDFAAGVEGITAESTGIAAGESEGIVKISASSDATEGSIPYAAIRATARTSVTASVHAPINLKVTP